MLKRIPLVILLLAFPPAQVSLRGAVIPDHWEKIRTLPAGLPIIVRLNSGENFPAQFEALQEKALVVSRLDSPGRLEIPRSAVCRIQTRDRVDDNVVDGFWKGALIGTAVGLPFFIVGLADKGDDATSIGTSILLMSALTGTGVGGVADALNNPREELYRASSCRP